MDSLITTERLYIKKTNSVTASELAIYQQRNRQFMAPYEPVRDEDFYTVGYWEKTLAEDCADEEADRSYHFYIYPKDNADYLIGFIGLTGIIRGVFQSCYLGYQLDEQYQSHGYMTEAVNVVAKYAFECLNLHRIEANIMPWNKPSVRVAEKCGFINEGVSHKYLLINGEWEDHIHMVRINADWKTDS